MSSPSPLIDAVELRERLGEVTVLDVRWRMGGPPGEAEHAAGHVPGAAYVDLDTALADPPGPGAPRGRHPLPDVDRFGEAMRAAGVGRGRSVVVYDDWGGRAAARCWWLLRWAGHADVRVLDGGWSAWREVGEVEAGGVDPERGDFEPRSGSVPTVDAAGAAQLATDGLLLDAREPERYRGEVEPVDPVAGHVPGAVNAPTSANLGPDGRFRDARTLAATYAAARDAPAAVYCGSGVTATHDLLAMAVAGIDGALWPGSWSEWVSDPSRPVATGDLRGTDAP